MKKHEGNLIISKDTEVDFEEITGILEIEIGAKFGAKNLKRVGGYLSINSQATLPKLETVGGYLSINSQAALPKLETVGGYLYINAQATLDAPKLETVGGYLSIYSQATLPKLETVGGYLSIYSQATLDAPKLETVGGYLSIYSQATLDAPKLETVGGDLSIYSQAALPKLETVGGDLYISSQATLDAPKLVNKNDTTAQATCKKALALSFKKKGLIKCDGILSWFKSKKKLGQLVVFRVQVVGKLKVSFVVQRGQQFSHGETVKKAIESLRYKLADRDTSRFKKWTLTTKVKAEDAIQAYRTITGACEFGVKNFCESIKVPKTITVSEVITLTQGKYGSDKFAAFFQ
jgi:hypothetical protein